MLEWYCLSPLMGVCFGKRLGWIESESASHTYKKRQQGWQRWRGRAAMYLHHLKEVKGRNPVLAHDKVVEATVIQSIRSTR